MELSNHSNTKINTEVSVDNKNLINSKIMAYLQSKLNDKQLIRLLDTIYILVLGIVIIGVALCIAYGIIDISTFDFF